MSLRKVTFASLAADGSTVAKTIRVDSADRDLEVSDAVFVAKGTFGSGTVKLQLSLDAGTTWVDADVSSLTAAGSKAFKAIDGAQYRATISGSTTPSVVAYIAGAGEASTVSNS